MFMSHPSLQVLSEKNSSRLYFEIFLENVEEITVICVIFLTESLISNIRNKYFSPENEL